MNTLSITPTFRRVSPTRGRRCTSIVAVAGLALALVAAGCDRRSQSAKTVASSSTRLHTVMGPSSGGADGSATEADKQYKAVVTEVSGTPDSVLPGEAASAKLLAAQSELGLTGRPLAEALRAEREVDNRVTVLRSVLSTWLNENAQAQAAALYDPSATITDAEKKAREFDAKSQSAAKTRDDLNAQVQQFQSQAKAKFDEAAAQETQIAALRQQATTVKATEAAILIQQAADTRKSADKIRTAGSLFQAQADQILPQFREAELLVGQYKAQAQTYRDAIAEMKKRDTEKKADTAKARSAAAAAAAELDKQLQEIAALRSGKLAESYAATVQAYQKASSTAAGASKLDQAFATTRITDGNIKQGLGDSYWSQAQGLMRYETLLRRLATVKPALPNAAKYGQDADQAKQAAADALSSAKDAYEAAANAYRSAKVRGEAKDQLDLLVGKLEAISQITAGQGLDALASLAQGTFKPKDESAEAAPNADGDKAAPTAAVEAPDPKAEVAAVIDQLLTGIRNADESAISGLTYSSNPTLQSAMVAQLKGVGLLVKLDGICFDKFKSRFSEKAMAMAKSMGQAGTIDPTELARISSVKGADIVQAVEGDASTLTLPGIPQPMQLKKIEGAWKFTAPDAAAGATPQQLEMTVKLTQFSNEGLAALATDIEAGKYTSLDEAFMAFNTQLQAKIIPLMQQMQGGGPGGGGGGG